MALESPIRVGSLSAPAAISRVSLTPAGRVLAVLLVAAGVLTDVALGQAAGDQPRGEAQVILFLALVTSQATALAIWMAAGTGSTARRLSLGISGVAGLTWLTIGAN